MILSHKNLMIHKEKITFKKLKHCSNNFIFIPIQYDQQDIMIQISLLDKGLTIS